MCSLHHCLPGLHCLLLLIVHKDVAQVPDGQQVLLSGVTALLLSHLVLQVSLQHAVNTLLYRLLDKEPAEMCVKTTRYEVSNCQAQSYLLSCTRKCTRVQSSKNKRVYTYI